MSDADMQQATVQIDGKPNEFAASGGSPPTVAMSSGLVEELATILADALLAEYEGEHERGVRDRFVERPSGSDSGH